MKLLLLGKGYIGKYLNDYLNKYHDILWVSKQEVDYTNPNTLKTLLEKEKPSWIINSSGFTGTPNVDGCEDNKEACYFYNVTAPLYITKVAEQACIPIIHIGSGCVYTGYDKQFSELDSPNFGADCFESSFYSKTKDTFEKLSSEMKRYVFRIRIPFNDVVEPKNYLYKLYKYNNLISCQNSLTNTNDLIKTIKRFIELKGTNYYKPNDLTTIAYQANGIINATNSGSIEAKEVIDLLKKEGLENPNWSFVDIESANFRVARSNCILANCVLDKLDLSLPCVKMRMAESVKGFVKNR